MLHETAQHCAWFLLWWHLEQCFPTFLSLLPSKKKHIRLYPWNFNIRDIYISLCTICISIFYTLKNKMFLSPVTNFHPLGIDITPLRIYVLWWCIFFLAGSTNDPWHHGSGSAWYDLASHQMVDNKYHLLEDIHKAKRSGFQRHSLEHRTH